MNNSEILEILTLYLDKDEILINEPMNKHTSFKIGGITDFLVLPNTVTKLRSTIKVCNEKKIPYYIMGNGSNLLVSDKGYRGVIIQIYKNLNNVEIKNNKVIAEAGILLSNLAKRIYEDSLEGFEFAAGIPGTLGGAVYMNAGAYGGEMKDIIEEATVITKTGELLNLSNKELGLEYRNSILQKNAYIAISVTLNLKKGDKEKIKAITDELNLRRKTKQPLELPSAGSAFKRPKDNFAGKLIMEAGLRGYFVGDARVSEKHCGFIVNEGNARAKDVKELIEYIQKTVKKKYNVDLEPEIKFLGEWGW